LQNRNQQFVEHFQFIISRILTMSELVLLDPLSQPLDLVASPLDRHASSVAIPAAGEHAPSLEKIASRIPLALGHAAEAKLDPFDPEKLRLSQDFAANIGIKKALITVPVRKPAKEWFVQVHPDAAYHMQTNLIELKEDRETYLVERDLWQALVGEATFGPRALYTTINRQGVVFLWPVRLPGLDGKLDSWNESAMEAVALARGNWVRVSANMSLGGYDVFAAGSELPPPVWPEAQFTELLRTAFKGRFIDSLDHLVLRKLRGEV
jgi:hypothetical protein